MPRPCPSPVPPSHPSSRVYPPPGRQLPRGAGPQDPHPSGDRFVLLAWVAPIHSASSAHSARSPPHIPVPVVWPLLPSHGPFGPPMYWHENTVRPGGCGQAGTPLHEPPLGLGGELCSVFCMLAPHAVLPSLTPSCIPPMADCPSDVCPSPLMAEGSSFCCCPHTWLGRAAVCVICAHDAGGARQQSTPSIQALAGVRVVASLLGHSRKQKKNRRCVLVPKHTWITWAAHPA